VGNAYTSIHNDTGGGREREERRTIEPQQIAGIVLTKEGIKNSENRGGCTNLGEKVDTLSDGGDGLRSKVERAYIAP